MFWHCICAKTKVKYVILVRPSDLKNGHNYFVQDGIMTEHVRVAIKGTLEWSDNVFDKKYKLMPTAKIGNLY